MPATRSLGVRIPQRAVSPDSSGGRSLSLHRRDCSPSAAMDASARTRVAVPAFDRASPSLEALFDFEPPLLVALVDASAWNLQIPRPRHGSYAGISLRMKRLN